MRNASSQTRGFTLIELLLVIGIIAILASIVIVAINPTKQLGDARNAQRRSDVNTILNAVYQYAIDNNGNLPGGIPESPAAPKEICRSGAELTTGVPANVTADTGDCVRVAVGGTPTGAGISLDALTGSYLVKIPVDPQAPTTGSGTRYTIVKSANGRVTVAAAQPEQSAVITVTR